jgi:hypothetical protein
MPFSSKSVIFDGLNEYVTMGDVLAAVFEYNLPFSVSCWFKNSSAGNHLIVSKQDGGAAFRGWSIFINVSNIYFQMVSSSSTLRTEIRTSGALYSDGKWHHLVCTYSAATPGDVADMSIYVDGVLATPATVSNTLGSNTISNSAPFNISGRNNGETLFNGSIDEVAVYGKELSAGEVTWLYNFGNPRDLAGAGAPSDLVGWWRMGEGDTYPTLFDQAGHDGTMVNMESGDIQDDAPLAAFTRGQPVYPLLAAVRDEGASDGRYAREGVSIGPGGGVEYRYKMRGQDSALPPPGYVTWVATFPDFDGDELGLPTLIPGSVREISKFPVY